MASIRTDLEPNVVWASTVRLRGRHLQPGANVDLILGNILHTLRETLYVHYAEGRTFGFFVHHFRAVFIIQNINDPAQSWAFDHGRSNPLSTITVEDIFAGIQAIQQSPTPEDGIEVRNLRFGFAFNDHTQIRHAIRGRGKTLVPAYIQTKFKETWTEQVYNFNQRLLTV